MYEVECSNPEKKCGEPIMNTSTQSAMRLWIVEFEIQYHGLTTNGCAVIKADSPSKVVSILTSNGIYNGYPHSYLIKRIEEIIQSPGEMLICEQINDIGD